MAKIAELTTETLDTELAEAQARLDALRAEKELRDVLPPAQRLADELHRQKCDDHTGMRARCDYYQEKLGQDVRAAYVAVAEEMLQIADEKAVLAIIKLAETI